MKVLIINFNRLIYPRNLADWVAERGCEPVFIDNKSDYPPLLDYYSKTQYRVVRLNKNFGHMVMWITNVLDILGLSNKRYIVTDPDLDLNGVPDDFLKVMNEGLDKYPYAKCGLSLEVNDLPDTPEAWKVKKFFEVAYWKRPLDDIYFIADVDTTFALYREGVRTYTHSAIRTNRPYTARHIPWYYTDMNKLPKDEMYYYKTANNSSSHKARLTDTYKK